MTTLNGIFKLSFLKCILLALIVSACNGTRSEEKTVSNNDFDGRSVKENVSTPRSDRSKTVSNEIPPKVYEVLGYIRQHNMAPDGYVGGKRFGNFERRLPLKDGNGKKMNYREWDVNPKRQGQNRGSERLITGSDRRAWYTSDHYGSFTEIR